MASSLFDSLFTDCTCGDCRYGEFDEGREQFYCNNSCMYCKWHDPDDDSPCTYFEQK